MARHACIDERLAAPDEIYVPCHKCDCSNRWGSRCACIRCHYCDEAHCVTCGKTGWSGCYRPMDLRTLCPGCLCEAKDSQCSCWDCLTSGCDLLHCDDCGLSGTSECTRTCRKCKCKSGPVPCVCEKCTICGGTRCDACGMDCDYCKVYICWVCNRPFRGSVYAFEDGCGAACDEHSVCSECKRKFPGNEEGCIVGDYCVDCNMCDLCDCSVVVPGRANWNPSKCMTLSCGKCHICQTCLRRRVSPHVVGWNPEMSDVHFHDLLRNPALAKHIPACKTFHFAGL